MYVFVVHIIHTQVGTVLLQSGHGLEGSGLSCRIRINLEGLVGFQGACES